jgi:hypothetical protein
MRDHAETKVLALAPSGTRTTVWTVTRAEAAVVAEAIHDAQPRWRIHIGGREAVFSREGKVVDPISSEIETA